MEDNMKLFEKKLQGKIKEKRFIHSVGVKYTAAALAMRYNPTKEFIDKAMIAGILHDNAKETANPPILHGKLGAECARTEFGIEDEDILNAITWHTTGRPDMSLLEKIIFIADYIEPSRDRQQNLEYVRQLAFTDIDKCVLKICEDTLGFLKSRSIEIDDMTERTYEFYKRRINND